MTKRFTIEIVKENDLFYILDNDKGTPVVDGRVICDLLNEQHEQIKELEQQVGNDYNEANSLTVRIANLTEELDYYKSKCGSLEEGYLKSQKENEQLKQRLEDVLAELYCKDRKLEELGVSIECCDKGDVE
jgi:chromosome segregation ATPase